MTPVEDAATDGDETFTVDGTMVVGAAATAAVTIAANDDAGFNARRVALVLIGDVQYQRICRAPVREV